MRYLKVFALAAAIALSALLMQHADAAQMSAVRVGLARGVTSGKLLGQGLSLKTAKGNVVTAANGASVSMKNGHLLVAGKQLSLPVTITAKTGLGWGRTRYRGALRIIKAGKGFTVINDVDIESYVRGVLNAEMSAKWHIEALKAQAVLARTYVFVNRGGYASEGFDVTDDTASQVYRGVNAETAHTDRAVAETQGMILTYAGKPAHVYYHSDSGGATADASDVWGKHFPYMIPIAEIMPNESPNASWRMVMTPEQIEAALAKMGKNIGKVRSLIVTRRDPYGRATAMRATGSSGSADFTAHAFRMAVGPQVLKSTNFALCAEGAQPQYRNTSAALPAQQTAPTVIQQASPSSSTQRSDPLIEMTQKDIFTKDEIYDMLFHPEKREQYLKIGFERMAGRGIVSPAQPIPAQKPAPQTSAPTVAVKIPIDTEVHGRVVLFGKGWGHGVGLSQWGAKAMADSGRKFDEILSHYYPGTVIAPGR